MKDKWNNPPNKTDNAELSTRQKKLKTFSPPKTCAFHRSDTDNPVRPGTADAVPPPSRRRTGFGAEPQKQQKHHFTWCFYFFIFETFSKILDTDYYPNICPGSFSFSFGGKCLSNSSTSSFFT